MAKRRKFTDQDRARVLALYKSGKTISEIAESEAMVRSVVGRMIQKAGGTLPPKKKAAKEGKGSRIHTAQGRGRASRYSMETKVRAVQLVQGGMNTREVANRLKVPRGLVNLWHRIGVNADGEVTTAQTPGKLNGARAPQGSAVAGGSLVLHERVKDAIVYLRHARDSFGVTPLNKMPRGQLLLLLALDTLEGRK